MKEAVSIGEGQDSGGEAAVTLDMHGKHRVHTLFSGTSFVTVNASTNVDAAARPLPPDGGAVAYVLRTGFSSSQVCELRKTLTTYFD
jgi:hypothetical protein